MSSGGKQPLGIGFLWLLWSRFSFRHARHDWRSTTGVVALLALGVGAYLSIVMASRAAVEGFRGFTEVVQGASDWRVTAPAGGLPNDDLRAMRQALETRPVDLLPVVETTAAFPREDGEALYGRTLLEVVGLDLVGIANLPFKHPGKQILFAAAGEQDEDQSLWDLLRSDRAAYVSAELAQTRDIGVGERFEVILNDRIIALEVAGILPELEGQVGLPGNIIVMDIALLQDLLGARKVDRVEVFLQDGPRQEERSEKVGTVLRKAGGERWMVREPENRQETGEKMTAAFRMNLQVLSLLALLVAVYLILMALDGAVVRRRQEIGVLRSLGVRSRTIRGAWLFESAAYGIAGGVLGILLGWALAQVTVRAVVQTVSALYQQSTAGAAGLAGEDIVLGLALGIGGSLLAGWIPAQDAAGTPPAQVLSRSRFSTRLPPLESWPLAVVLIVLGGVLAQLPPWQTEGGGRFPAGGYGAALCWLVGGTIVAARLLPLMGKAVHGLGAFSAAVRVATGRLTEATSRHQLAVAGLFISIAMAAAMGILVGSFEKTLVSWVNLRFKADVFVSSAGIQGGGAESRIQPATWQALANDPRVVAADPLARAEVEVDGRTTTLAGSNLDLIGERLQMRWVEKPTASTVPEVADAAGLVNESFAYRFDKQRGDFVEVPTPTGPRTVWIEGIYADYGNEAGTVLVRLDDWAQWFNDPSITNISLFLREGAEAEEFRNQYELQYPALRIRTQEELRTDIVRIFRQTFGVTDALRIIAVGVALGGLALALVAIVRESRRDLQTMSAIGMSRREVASSLALEGLGLAVAGLVVGVVASIGLGWLLIYVINRQSFGWTLYFSLPWIDWLWLAALTLVASAAVSWTVGFRASASLWRKRSREEAS